MFKAFVSLIALLYVLALATFIFTLFCQLKFKNSNWKVVRLVSNSILIFSELFFIAIHYFSNKFKPEELISLLIWIINFAASYYIWQNSKNP